MFDEFQKEQNAILEKLVFDGIYPKLVKQNRHAIIDGVNDLAFMLELFLTPTCDKECTYCYLQKHKNDLYPPEINQPAIIKKNLKILLNNFIEKGYTHLNRVDIFTGEIWNTDFGYEILDIVLKYVQAGLKLDNFVLPTNGSFLYNDDNYKRMKNYADAFIFYGCNFTLSFSYDGYFLDLENRPFKNKAKNNESQEVMLQRLKEFHENYHFGFHPMIYAENIEKQIQNFDWWTEFLTNEDVFEHIMFLEVRNDNWTTQNITEYLKWLQHIIIWHYNYLAKTEKDFSMEKFLQTIFGIGEISSIKSYNYLPQRLAVNRTASCGLTQGLCIRLGDLGICPCHRTAYDKLMIGNFIVENDRITGIQANNPSMGVNIWMNGDNSWIKCDACALRKYCIKGCRGSQFETHREPLYPVDSACEHAYAKQLYLLVNYMKLINKYNLKNLFAWRDDYAFILRQAQQQDPGRYNKWIPIIQTLPLEL